MLRLSGGEEKSAVTGEVAAIISRIQVEDFRPVSRMKVRRVRAARRVVVRRLVAEKRREAAGRRDLWCRGA